jgi:hypothetical protein
MNKLKSIFVGLMVFIVSVITVIIIVIGNISMYLLAPLILAVVGGVAYYDMKKDGTL